MPFSIKLENCDLAELKQKSGGKNTQKNIVNIAFTGSTVNSKPSMLSTTGGTGVGIMISVPGEHSYINMNGTPTPTTALMNGKNEISLEAVALAAEGDNVHPGAFNATASFLLNYE